MVPQHDDSSLITSAWFWQFVLRSGSKSPGGYWPPGSAGSAGQERAVEGIGAFLHWWMMKRTCVLKRNFKAAKTNQYWTAKTISHFLLPFFSCCAWQLMTTSNPSFRGRLFGEADPDSSEQYQYSLYLEPFFCFNNCNNTSRSSVFYHIPNNIFVPSTAF